MDEHSCVAMDRGICITADGYVTPCCATRDNENFKHISEIENIKEYYISDPKLDSYRSISIQDVSECSTCIEKTKMNIISRKQKLDNRAPNLIPIKKHVDDRSLLTVDLSLSNICNQQCVMCSSTFSSKWYEDDIHLIKIKSNLRHPKAKAVSSWSISEENIDQMVELLNHKTKLIEFKGGEPLYDKKFYSTIEKFIKKSPYAKYCITTNGTNFSDKFIKFLNEYSIQIDIAISLDSIGRKYDWIRGYSFEEFEKSVYKLVEKCTNKRVALSFNCTSMVYNVTEYARLYKWVRDIKLKRPDIKIIISFQQVVSNVSGLSPIYASPADLVEGINQLESIAIDTELSIMKLGIDQTIAYLKNSIDHIHTDRTLFKLSHEDLVKIRGWDIYE